MNKKQIQRVLDYCIAQSTNVLICKDRRQRNNIKVLDQMWHEQSRVCVIDTIHYDDIDKDTARMILSDYVR